MITLGIETATSVCSVALVENGKIIAEKSLLEPNVHSEKIILLIDEILNNRYDYDKIAVSIGPGSFTGLRVGLSTAKGLAYASKKPIVPISTLKALAYNIILNEPATTKPIIPLLDARRDEFYCAVYKYNNNTLTEIFPPNALLFNELKEIINPEIEYSIIGEGVEKFKKLSEQTNLNLKNLKFYSTNVNFCSAISIALLAESIEMRYDLDFVSKLEPLYLKDFQTHLKTKI